MDKQTIYDWKTNPPPKDTVVMAAYILNGGARWQLVKTCKHGCCVSDLFNAMVLPDMWAQATNEELQEWEGQVKRLQDKKEFTESIWDLFKE